MNTLNSIRSYEYTRRAIEGLSAHMETIHGNNSEAAYHFLLEEMRAIPVCDYLKRYLYLHAQIEDAYEEVSEETYVRIIKQAFREHHTPLTLKKDSVKKPSAIIKDWLQRTRIRRETAFLLGFGLGMSAKEMSDFLTKAMKEIDFDLMDREEAIYWHCLHTGKDYYEMRELRDRFADADRGVALRKDSFYEVAACNPEGYLFDEAMLFEYLIWLERQRDHRSSKARDSFEQLYQSLKRAKKEERDSFLEEYYYCSIPSEPNGNLLRIAESQLRDKIGDYRLTRQRVSGIRHGKLDVTRNDLITLLFFRYCDAYDGGGGTEVLQQFAAECDRILTDCHMYSLYAANPYEAFLLICLMAEDPLDMFSEIWELSLKRGEEESDEC